MYSKLATAIPKLRTKLTREGKTIAFSPHPKKWFGICVHTTGRGVPQKAERLGRDPDDIGIEVYSNQGMTCPHYLIGSLGHIYCITDESFCAPHCDVKADERKMMLDGSWIDHVSKEGLTYWQKRWPNFKSPQHLFPSSSGNKDYIGIEMIPSLHFDNIILEKSGVKMFEKSVFNESQYSSLRSLITDIQSRNNMNFNEKNRLVGHEDLQPFERWDSRGGWDPGYLREQKYFFWEKVK